MYALINYGVVSGPQLKGLLAALSLKVTDLTATETGCPSAAAPSPSASTWWLPWVWIWPVDANEMLRHLGDSGGHLTLLLGSDQTDDYVPKLWSKHKKAYIAVK